MGTDVSYQGLERAANKLTARVKGQGIAEGQITLMFQYRNGGFVGNLGYNFYGRGEEKLCLNCLCNPDDYYYAIKGDRPVKMDSDASEGGFYSPSDSDINQTGDVIANNLDFDGFDSALLTDVAITFSNCSCSTCGNGNVSLCPATHPNYISNTIFGALGYHWDDVDWKPYLGVIGKVDIGSKNTALRLWGVYLKGGICF